MVKAFDQDENVNPATGEITEDKATDLAMSIFGDLGIVTEGTRDADAVTRDIARRMSKAKSLDDLFSVNDARSSDMLVGKTLKMLDVEFSTYEKDGRVMPLARVTAVERGQDDEDVFITTASNLVTFLARARQIEAFPFEARITSKPSRGGNDVLQFERA